MAAVTKTKKSSPAKGWGQSRFGPNVFASALAAGAVFSSAAGVVVAPPALFAAAPAMDAHPPVQRVVQGRVVNKADSPIPGAVVYLKDTRSLSVKSYLTDDSGRFHFGQLADGADYEVWAEQNGKRSGSKSISQFNSKLEIQFTLKIDQTQ